MPAQTCYAARSFFPCAPYFCATNHLVVSDTRKRKVCLVGGFGWSFLAEVFPGVALSLVGFVAAVPPYVLLRQSDRGRARSAISYLCGLAAGLAVTACLATLSQTFADADAITAAGLLSSFLFPFVGMARAKWDGPRKKKSRRPALARSVPQ
jgi:predicted lysophospholipase L1 biosynthesis ABC-type transport system permease subunit